MDQNGIWHGDSFTVLQYSTVFFIRHFRVPLLLDNYFLILKKQKN